MATPSRITRTLAGCLLGAALAACSSSPSSPPAGAAGSQPAATTAAGASTAPVGSSTAAGGGGGAGQAIDVCGLFTDADISTALGTTFTKGGPAAGEAVSCSWGSDDLTTAYLYRTDPGECDDTKSSLTDAGPIPGADFAGSSATLDATFVGVVRGSGCYVVEGAPSERSPKVDALGQLLAQFVQRAGA